MTFRHPIAPAVLAAGMAQHGPTVRRFAPRGPLALNPAAFGLEMVIGEPPERRFEMRGDVAVVEIVGPLMHHQEPWCDSYDAIKTRVGEALASSARVVLMSIDSPGGLVAGCFDCVTELRAMADQAGKPLHAYVDAQATSAAYALCCAADRVWIPPAGIVGSIGVIDAMVDATAQDAAMGLGVTVITSGAHKADGNPHAPTTPEAIRAAQEMVDTLAGHFFGVVAGRRAMEPEAVRRLDAGLLCGVHAIAAGLADEVATFDQVLAALSASAEPVETRDEDSAPTGASTAQAQAEATQPPDDGQRKAPMADLGSVKSGLQSVIDDDTAEPGDRERARAALKALDATAESDKDAVKADEDGDHKEPDGDECKPVATDDEDVDDKPAEASAMALAAQVQSLSAWKARTEEASERASLMATRPDFKAATVAWLATQSISVVRSACQPESKGGLPLGDGPGGQVAAARAALTGARAPTIGATSAQGQRDGITRTDVSGHGAELDERMGIVPTATVTGRDPNHPNEIRLGVMTPEEARAFRANRAAAIAAATPKGVK